MANYLALENDPVNFLPARVNPNLAAQGRRYNLAERQQTSPLMQAGNAQLAKEFSSMGNRGSVTDLINRGLIANTAGLPVDVLNTVLQTLGLGSEQPLGGSDSMRRALEYYGLSSETQRPMLETLTSLTPPRAVMGAARVAGQGAEAVGRAAAPVAGQALKNYMGNTGMMLNAVPSTRTAPSSAQFVKADVVSAADDLTAMAKSMGLNAEVRHSGSNAGKSSYVTVFDPMTNRYIKSSFRISDHGTGPLRYQEHIHINSPADLATQKNDLFEWVKRNRIEKGVDTTDLSAPS